MTRETAIYWPEEDLGCPLRAGYSRKQQLRITKMAVQDGPARFRLSSDDEPNVVEVSFLWTAAQLETWETFHDVTLRTGAYWFHMPMLTGTGMVDCYAHLVGGWQMRRPNDLMDRTEVTFTLEMFRTAHSAPPPLVLSDPVDALTITDTRPTDIYDGDEITETRPTDRIDGLSPEFYL